MRRTRSFVVLTNEKSYRRHNFRIRVGNKSWQGSHQRSLPVGRVGEAQRRCRRAVSYVIRRRGIEASRIVTVDGGYREDLTVELWVLPPGATPPTASPTVEPREVRFIKGKPKGRARLR